MISKWVGKLKLVFVVVDTDYYVHPIANTKWHKDRTPSGIKTETLGMESKEKCLGDSSQMDTLTHWATSFWIKLALHWYKGINYTLISILNTRTSKKVVKTLETHASSISALHE